MICGHCRLYYGCGNLYCLILPKKAYSYLSKLLFFNGHIILYYLTLRLYFFQENPVIENPAIVLILLVLVTAYFLFLAYKKKSQFQFGFVLLLLLGSGVVSNSTHFMLAITLVISILTFDVSAF